VLITVIYLVNYLYFIFYRNIVN